MSKLQSALKERGLKAKTSADTKKKSSLLELDAPKNVQKAIDDFLAAKDAAAAAAAKVKSSAATIVEFGLKEAFKHKTAQNVLMASASGGKINLNFKDQYTLKADNVENFKKAVKKCGIKTEVVTENTQLSFDYSSMTADEEKKLFDSLVDVFGAERSEQLLTERTTYTIDKCLDKVFANAKKFDDISEMRQLSGHHTPTVALYKEKK